MSRIPTLMNAIFVDNPGKQSSLRITELAVPTPTEDQLLIKVAAAGINRADLMQRRGLYPPPKGESDILGLEVAGTVVGASDKNKHWLGKNVFGLVPGGGYAEYAVLHAGHALEVPEGYSMAEAAATAEVFLTAYQLLFSLGDLQKGQRTLIHAGASGVGTAAIQLAKAIGADVAVTASSDKKLEACKALGADVLINYKTSAFEEVLASHWPLGAHVILDSIAGQYISREASLLAMDGKIIVYALMGGKMVEGLDLSQVFRRRGQVICSTLRNRTDEYKTALTQGFNQRFSALLAARNIKPVLHQEYHWQDAQSAHQLLETNDTIGKLVLTF